MTIDMVKNPISGTYEYQPEPRFRLKHLFAPGVIDLLAMAAFAGWFLANLFL